MGYPYFDFPEPGSAPEEPGSDGGGNVILQGYGGGFLILQGYGGAGSTPVATLPISLPAALAELILDGSVISSFPGGYHGNQLPLRATYPCVVGFVREGRIESRTNSNDRVLTPILLRVYDTDPDLAYDLSGRLDAAVAGKTLDFAGAVVTKLLRDGEPRMGWQAARSSTGRVEYTERKYVCRVRRPSLSVR